MVARSIEIRPKTVKNAILMGICCTLFSIAGLWMIFFNEEIFVGLLVITFFGIGGLFAIPKILRRKVTMVLTPQGLEQHYAEGIAFIPWSDVEMVGIIPKFSIKMVGIRLRSYDRYINGMSPSLAKFITKNLPFLKLLTCAASLLDVDDSRGLINFGKVGNLAEALLWTRQQFGYDLALSLTALDRSAPNFVSLLDEYRGSL
jgi:hypothetical protein